MSTNKKKLVPLRYNHHLLFSWNGKHMATLIMKFGGTSVGSIEAINQAIRIIENAKRHWDNVCVVISAFSGVTDILLKSATDASKGITDTYAMTKEELKNRSETLIDGSVRSRRIKTDTLVVINELLEEFEDLCKAIAVLGEATPRALDAVVSIGERISVPVLTSALIDHGLDAVSLDSRILIITDDIYQSANPIYDLTSINIKTHLSSAMNAGKTPIVTGFIGASEAGITTTLGRGGSDFTAAIIGSLLPAEEVWIWTDVSGIMTADPRIVPDAKTIDVISFREVAELAYFGAKVLHPKTIRPIIEAGIPLRVLNTFDPDHPGTSLIADQEIRNGHVIKAITMIENMKLVTIEGRGMLGVPGVAARTFSAIASTNTSVPLISQASSEQSICFAVPAESAEKVIRAVEFEFEREIKRRDIDSVWATEEVVIISVVGAGMRSTPGVSGRVFSALGDSGINVIAIAQGSSEVSISFIVSSNHGNEAVSVLHKLTL
jgi:bifunctional aspartokinase / homoserine dehydrogenase 1